DCDGDVSRRFSDDFLLTQASLYWFTNSISTSFRPYYDGDRGLLPDRGPVEVPTALALFPADIGAPPPRSWVERAYRLTRYTVMPCSAAKDSSSAVCLVPPVPDEVSFLRPKASSMRFTGVCIGKPSTLSVPSSVSSRSSGDRSCGPEMVSRMRSKRPATCAS